MAFSMDFLGAYRTWQGPGLTLSTARALVVIRFSLQFLPSLLLESYGTMCIDVSEEIALM